MKEIPMEELKLNPMALFADGWTLITAGNGDRGMNTMTAAWGHLGSLWGEGRGLPTAVVYVRPQRYTRELLDREEWFTLSFLGEEYREVLGHLGSRSGRDGDKLAGTGLQPVWDDRGTWFNQAKLVLICRKLYQAPLVEEGFRDLEILERKYPHRDFHRMYIGQIVQVLAEEPPEHPEEV